MHYLSANQEVAAVGEFTYNVFLAVASMIGALLTLFVGVIAAALLHDSRQVTRPVAEPHPESQQPYRWAA